MTATVLFRYRPVNESLYDSLRNSTIYFASPESLNDPFDCQIDIDGCVSVAIDESEVEPRAYLETLKKAPKFSPSLQEALKGVGICSFSLTLTDPLMWAHYADNHRGVCLAYRFEEEFFRDEHHKIIGVAPVEYGASPLRNWLTTVAPTLGAPASRAMGAELCKKLFTVKGECWAHEKEIRAIRESPGPFDAPKDSLIQVCFGLRMPAEAKATVRSCITHNAVEYCQITRDGTDFGIEAKDI